MPSVCESWAKSGARKKSRGLPNPNGEQRFTPSPAVASTAAAASRRRRRACIGGPPFRAPVAPDPGQQAASYQHELGIQQKAGQDPPDFRLASERTEPDAQGGGKEGRRG